MADIDVGQVLEQLNNKVDLPAGDSQDGIDFVVDWQKPTEENGYTWYRKYKSGWVEQGGISTVSPVVYPLPMSDTNYTLVCVPHLNANAQIYWADFGHTKTTTGFEYRTENGIEWQVSGMGA